MKSCKSIGGRFYLHINEFFELKLCDVTKSTSQLPYVGASFVLHFTFKQSPDPAMSSSQTDLMSLQNSLQDQDLKYDCFRSLLLMGKTTGNGNIVPLDKKVQEFVFTCAHCTSGYDIIYS
ncbi:hypothetical protein DR999_PMT00787 [Platysternon megacephalum]|uniref:Uncharacterized protein n=1 Tax=Platysternon megacephalum TaxID=55544 RepID=A0A4D9F7X9_9SAUR|nr:hypothetical protein DR999_PMT00787 [Platysternon megacephalum]